jgi:peptide/nickel transport system ATP-binding protein
MRRLRGQEMAMIFQDPLSSLHPFYKVGAQLMEAVLTHRNVSKSAARNRAIELLELVGIPDPKRRVDAYPHEFSGGMRQRAMIAMALLFTPELVIMDEPTSALDVVAQQSLMTKIRELQRQLGFAVLFVTHDMSVVSRYSDRVIVMYAGQIAEAAPTEAIFERPLHPYSRGLMNAFPSIRGVRREMAGIPGAPPDLARPPSGCRFHPRCPDVMDICPVREPALYEREGALVRCLLYAEDVAPAARAEATAPPAEEAHGR